MARRLLLGVALAAAAVSASAAFADTEQCAWLQRQYLSALASAGGGQSVARRLGTMQNQARRLNCYGGGFLFFFGPPRSPQCPAIMAEINRLQWQLRGQDQSGFGGMSRLADLRDALQFNGCGIPSPGVGDGRYRAVCVRTCDGYFFPVEAAATRSRLKVDAAACQSMYAEPGQAELFYYRPDTDPAEAKSIDGKRYGDQSYAFQYRNSYSAACATQLTRGIAALRDRYLTVAKESGKVSKPLASMAAGVPMPVARQPASEDPATIDNAAGAISVARPASALADAVTGVRQVGDGWYAGVYSTTGKASPGRPLAARKTVPGFLVGTAKADELDTPE